MRFGFWKNKPEPSFTPPAAPSETVLIEAANALPSMGGREIGPELRRLASSVLPGQSILEVGCWLGAGTAHLALGARASGAPIHVYDRFKASADEVDKARRLVGLDLEEGQDTLPLVQENLARFEANIHWHRGDLRRARWVGGPIGLWVDDASKLPKVWAKSVGTFLPHVPVGGHIVLMDYYFYEKAGRKYQCQENYMEHRARDFELISERPGGTTTAIFRRVH